MRIKRCICAFLLLVLPTVLILAASPAFAAFSTVRIKAGAAYTDSTGAVWSSDTSICTGGSTATTTHAVTGSLPGASDQALYQPERYGNSTCTIAAPAGTYNVTIKLAEDYWTAAGKRLFSVSINGTTVLSAFDIYAAAGASYKALDKTFSTTTTGSPITIKFLNGSVDNAKFDAVQISAGSPSPAPSISSVNPTSGIQGQSLAAAITGSNFQSGATCGFGAAGIAVVSCAFNSATQVTANITVASTATLSARTVTVTNPDAQSASLAAAFTVIQAPAPVISSITPTSGIQGQALAVVVTGSNFQSGATCGFGAAGIAVTSCVFNSPTQVTANITVASTATLSARTVTVTNPDSQSSSLPAAFTVNQAPAPVISSISPVFGVQSQTLAVVVTGNNFQSGATCGFGAADIAVTSCVFNSATQLTANITIASTATPSSRTVTVTNTDSQNASLAASFMVNQAPPPPAFSTVRIKAGAAYTDSTGAVWSSDTSICTGGSTATTTHAVTGSLPGASDQALYQPERYGNSTCTIAAPAGTYNVTIKLAEDYWTAAGKRLFSVSINGTTVLSAFDIYAAAGASYKALDKTFSTTTTGSPITIKFLNGSVDNAKFDAVQIAASNSPPPTYTISGTINGVGGATVSLSGASTATTIASNSASNSTYSFVNLANGGYAVTPSLSGYNFSPTSQAVSINNANPPAVPTFQVSAVVPPPNGYAISGTITPSSTGAGASATVTLSGPVTAVTTVTNGSYSFTGLSAASGYIVTPTAPGAVFTPASQSVTINNADQAANFTAATLIFYDDFAGTALSSNWTTISRHGEYSQNETECNVPQEVSVANSLLTITTDAAANVPPSESVCGDFNIDGSVKTAAASWPYVTGDVQWTSLNFTYGTIEIRAQLPSSATNLWPATWLLGSNCQVTNTFTGSTGYSTCPNIGSSGYTEIDMTECYNAGGWCQFHIANPNFGIGGGCDATYPVDTNYHVFTTVWTKASVTQYMDGTLVTTCAQKLNNPMFLILQTQTGGVGGTPNAASLPAQFNIDYIKVTQP